MKFFFKRHSFKRVPCKQSFLKRTWLLPFSISLYLILGTTVSFAAIKTSNQSGTAGFSGQHAGMDFDGKFERWQATLILPPKINSSIVATFYIDSAKTGDSIYDSTLPEFDWFDVENHPVGNFVSTNITLVQGGYQVSGNLTLKAITKPVDFMLIDSGKKLSASFDINRLVYQIGLESDPDAEWVSETISISMLINK
jgi:polyisoprenoid-binding protein YceI